MKHIETCPEVDCEGIGQCPCRDWTRYHERQALYKKHSVTNAADLIEVLVKLLEAK